MNFQFSYTIIILVYYRLKGCVFLSKKKLLSFVLCLCILFSCIFFIDKMPVSVSGTSVIYESPEPVIPPESDFTYRTYPADDPTEASITGYSGKETKIIIPETLGGLPVTALTLKSFSGNEKITYVKLPSSLKSVSIKAFNMCSSLTEFDINPENEFLSVIDGVLYRKDTDEDSETYGKPTTLVCFPAGKGGHFTIPYGIQTIAAYAFDHCYNLTSVDMYNTVTEIKSHAFSYCWNLENIRLSDNLYSLGQEALAHCDSLKRIDLPASLSSIGKDAVLGTIDSDDNKVYFFINGISCMENSYAYNYLIDQALPEDIIIKTHRSITDNDTRIKLIDAYDALPESEAMDIEVSSVEINDIEAQLPIRYANAYVFDVEITQNDVPFKPDDKVIFDFTAVCPDAIPSATKVYQQIGDELILVSGSAHTPFVGAQVSQGGRFIILENNDFSLKGDVDGDGIVSLFDVKTAMHASIGTLTLTPEQLLTANVDNSEDGKITTKDARKILRLAGGMSID